MNIKYIVLWFALPLLILGAVEAGVRKIGQQRETWYPQVIRDKSYLGVQVIALGSSRVGAAVNSGETDMRILNLGRGYSTTAEHYLGLKRMVQSDPNALQGKLVLIEATGGLPEHIAYRGGAWFDPGNPSLMTKVISSAELPDLWQCNAPSELKWEVTLRLAANKLALFRYKELVQGLLVSSGSKVTENLTWRRETTANLSDAAGIRTDDVSQAAARKLAMGYLAQQRKDTRPLDNWSGTCIDKIIKLVKNSGGKVGFFETPLHSTFRAFYEEAPVRQNAARFAKFAKLNAVPILRPKLTFADSSFPDIWHLAQSDSKAYTAALEAEIEKVLPR